MVPSVKEQMDVIKSGVVELLPEEELEKKLERSKKNNKPLIIKLGCDPSKPDLHLGHAVVLQKMRQFQDLGHKAVLIIGDFTAMIGDPSGRNKTRPQLTMEETKINGETYLAQATAVLSKNNLEVRYNSEWLSKMNFAEVINLAAQVTVAQLLERDDFEKRYKGGQPISLHEFLYPLAQAMDSAAIESDVELGGTDQKFNLLLAREVQQAYDKDAQCILTMPILEGTSGVEKMSKSLDNYIALTELPKDMFGKVMSIPDNLIIPYFRYGAFAGEDEIAEMEAGLKNNTIHPRDAKVKTAMRIVELYYDKEAAKSAHDEFNRMFQDKGIPDDIPEYKIDSDEINITDMLVQTGLAPSKKQARTLLLQNAVSVDEEKVSDPGHNIDLSEEKMIKVGKRKFMKLKKR